MELAAGPELGSLLAEACSVYKLPRGVKRDIHFLEKELENIQAFLSEIGEVRADELDEQTKARAADLRDLSIHIQHVADNLRGCIRTHRSRMADLQGLKGFAARINFKLGSLRARHEFATSIKELKIRLKEAADRQDKYKMDSVHGPARKHAMTEDDGLRSLPDTEDLVGIDSHKEKLVKILTEEGGTSSQDLKVVAIVGNGPVGKTTLAKVVYDSIAHQFHLAAWVTVSSRPDITMILRRMLRQISQEDQNGYFDEMDPKQLIDKIRRTLKEKRYLIVVDNILDEPEWELLKCALIDNKFGSAVLMTSRNHGHIAHFVGTVHKLLPLSEVYSRKLFYTRLFGSEDQCPPELEGIYNFFLERCGGIPATIITVSRLLEGKKSKTKDELYSFYASVYSGLLFENDLPPHLKPCLLYLSMFRKGCEINAEQLLWQWLAEGFIHETDSEGRTLLELGEHYLSELLSRKLIEAMDVNAGGRVLYCRVSETVHELIIAMSKQENFSTVLDEQQGRSLTNMVYRLSIQGSKRRLFEQELSQVKSLAISGGSSFIPALSALQDLRVLDLGQCSSLQNNDIKDIGNLFHLKCLIIGGKCITLIPEKIGSLLFLETLDLRESGVIELPERIFQVKQLKRLYVNSCTKIPHGIGKLEALQELGDINVCNPELLQELCNLTKLRFLRIAIWSWDESLKMYDVLLENLRSLIQVRQNIQSLSILTSCSLDFMDKLGAEWNPSSLQKLEIRYGAFDNKLPIWIDSLEYLSSLSIEVNDLSQDIICKLGKLPKLCSLSLTSKHAMRGKFGIKADGFEQLSSLSLESSVMEKVFTPEPEALQMLKRVNLSFQASRTEDVNKNFSFGLEDLCALEQVHVKINCFNASRQVLEDSEMAIRDAISHHSCQPNLVIRRVRENDMVGSEEESALHDTKQKKQMHMKNKKSSNKKTKITAKTLQRRQKGVPRKYKIISLQLNSQILTLQAL